MTEAIVRRRVRAHGRVQGVFFRDSVRREAERRDVSANSTNAAADFEDNVIGTNANCLLQNSERFCSAGQQLILLRCSGDVHLGAVVSVGERRPHRFVLRSPVLLLARSRGIHLLFNTGLRARVEFKS